MANTLREIVENKKREIAARAAAARELPAPVPARGTFLPSMRRPGTRLIAEIKPKSPSAGELASNVDLDAVTCCYTRYAAAISVLTDEKYFGGSLEALATVAAATDLPTLCKDFILDEAQVDDARRAGAEAVLLIVKILDDEQLARLHAKITALNMVPVVEVQNEVEIERAARLPLQCVLINNRNLETFETDLATTEALAKLLPADVLIVSASGVESRSDIERLSKYTNAFLVGSSLMRAGAHMDAKLRELAGVSRLVKVCGITSIEDARAAIDSGADLLGLIFVPESPRSVSAEVAGKICEELGGERFVGVFRDASLAEIQRTRKQVGFRFVQLHGDEEPDMVAQLFPVIKAVTVGAENDVRKAARFGSAAFVLFDLSKMCGVPRVSVEQIIEWINAVEPRMPFLLAGGLTAESVANCAAKVTAKNFVGVDVASGVETSPGVKSAERLNSFIKEAKSHAVTR